MAAFPAFDLTDLDLSRLPLGVPSRLTEVARDATYVGIGLAVLGFQRAQVQRRQLLRALQHGTGSGPRSPTAP